MPLKWPRVTHLSARTPSCCPAWMDGGMCSERPKIAVRVWGETIAAVSTRNDPGRVASLSRAAATVWRRAGVWG